MRAQFICLTELTVKFQVSVHLYSRIFVYQNMIYFLPFQVCIELVICIQSILLIICIPSLYLISIVNLCEVHHITIIFDLDWVLTILFKVLFYFLYEFNMLNHIIFK